MKTAVKSKPPLTSSRTRAITGVRVLTSSQCLAIIKEKQMKKKHEEKDKEKRKIVREVWKGKKMRR